jgi:hypothetical protein
MSTATLPSLPVTPAGACDGRAPELGVASSSAPTTWPTTCPVCGSLTRWKLSGRGKHLGQLCETHGFVAIRQNPIYASSQAAQNRKRPGIFRRLLAALKP